MPVSAEAPASDSMAWSFQPVTFGRGREPNLFGWYHPASAPARECGVVLCNPFAYEMLGSHRSYRVLAEQLAAEGFPVLRFDYQGTGDSAGSDADPQRIATWIANIGTAIDQLKQLAAVARVSLFGLRLSASFAVMAAQGRSDVSALVLWAPIANGRHLVRELKLLNSTSAANAALGDAAVAATDGSIESAGFRHSAETLADIGKIDLLKQPAPGVAHIALLPREAGQADQALISAWASAGSSPTLLDLPGYAAMVRDPDVSIVPSQAIAAIVDWLKGIEPSRTGHTQPALTACAELHTPAESGADLREYPLRFGAQMRLFGILTHPETTAGDDIAVIFVNSGGNHRIGPSRLTVPLARYLASLGHAVLRMDIAGMGDSARLPGPLPIFQLSSVADIREAIDHLSQQHDGRFKRFVVVGLCSGGFLAHHATLQDARINSQITLNQPSFEWKGGNYVEAVEQHGRRGLRPFRHYAQAALAPETWKRIFSGEVRLLMIIELGSQRLLKRLAVRLQRWYSLLRPDSDTSIAGQFRALSRRGVKSLIVLSANDTAIPEMETQLGKNGSALAGDDNFRYVVIEGADHTFTAVNTRKQVFDIMRRHFESLH